jgi:hypothetical protein
LKSVPLAEEDGAMNMNDIRKFSKEDVLGILGLEPRRSAASTLFGSLGLLGLGLIVGAGAALLMAPRSGEQLRRELGERLDGTARRLAEGARETLQRHD